MDEINTFIEVSDLDREVAMLEKPKEELNFVWDLGILNAAERFVIGVCNCSVAGDVGVDSLTRKMSFPFNLQIGMSSWILRFGEKVL